jgi:hypothetical protein
MVGVDTEAYFDYDSRVRVLVCVLFLCHRSAGGNLPGTSATPRQDSRDSEHLRGAHVSFSRTATAPCSGGTVLKNEFEERDTHAGWCVCVLHWLRVVLFAPDAG